MTERQGDKLHTKCIWIGLVTWLILVAPIVAIGIPHGHDLNYHMMRIESLSNELQLAVFPVRIGSAFLDGFCYPSSIYYNDIFLLVPAFLRMGHIPLMTCYMIYLILIQGATLGIGYYSFSRLLQDSSIGMIVAVAYTLSNYRLMNIYARAALGEYTAYAFLPLVAYGMHRVLHDEEEIHEKYLVVGMTGLICSHVLSTEMIVLGLCFTTIIYGKRAINRKRVTMLIKAAVETILINLWYLLPFIDYYWNVDARINHVNIKDRDFEGHAITYKELINILRSPYGYASDNVAVRMQLTLGFTLLVAVLLGAIILISRCSLRKKELMYWELLGIGMLWMSSKWFPWNRVRAIPLLGSLLCSIQFPWRYLGVASLCFSMVLGIVLLCFKPQLRPICYQLILYGTFIIAILGGILFLRYAYGGTSCYSFLDPYVPDSYSIGEGEYLLYGVKDAENKITCIGNASARLQDRKGTTLSIAYEKNGEAYVIAPIFYYKGFEAIDLKGKHLEVTESDNRMMKILLPKQEKGVIYVRFKEPMSWRVAEFISIGIAVMYLVQISRKKRKNCNN